MHPSSLFSANYFYLWFQQAKQKPSDSTPQLLFLHWLFLFFLDKAFFRIYSLVPCSLASISCGPVSTHSDQVNLSYSSLHQLTSHVSLHKWCQFVKSAHKYADSYSSSSKKSNFYFDPSFPSFFSDFSFYSFLSYLLFYFFTRVNLLSVICQHLKSNCNCNYNCNCSSFLFTSLFTAEVMCKAQ